MADEEKKEEKPQASASEAAKKAQELGKQRSKKLVGNLILVIIVMTIIGVCLSSIGWHAVFAFISIAIMPGIVAIITDRRPGRFASKTVTAFNFAGAMRYVVAILGAGSPNEAAASILKDPMTWLIIYGFAAFGWGVIYIIPQIVQLYIEIKASYTVNKLIMFRKKLIDEWGEDIKK